MDSDHHIVMHHEIILINEEYFKSFRGMLSPGKLKEEMRTYKTEEKKQEDRKLNLHRSK